MMKEYSCKVISKQMLNCDTAFIEIECPDIAASSHPGQFVNISCSRFLKRPFGIASCDTTKGTFKIGVKVVGKGTSYGNCFVSVCKCVKRKRSAVYIIFYNCFFILFQKD